MKHLLLLVLFSLLVPASICAQEVLFFDDFEGGMDDAWEMPDGGWEVVGGRLQNMVPEGPLYAGGENQSDYIVSFDFDLFSFSDNYAIGCYISLSDNLEDGTYNGYYLGCSVGENGTLLIIGRVESSEFIYLMGLIWFDFATGVRHIELGRTGSELYIKLWEDVNWPPFGQVSVIDETYHSGYWMPFLDSCDGWIDNFQVEGYGTTSTQPSSWGGVKALYR